MFIILKSLLTTEYDNLQFDCPYRSAASRAGAVNLYYSDFFR